MVLFQRLRFYNNRTIIFYLDGNFLYYHSNPPAKNKGMATPFKSFNRKYFIQFMKNISSSDLILSLFHSKHWIKKTVGLSEMNNLNLQFSNIRNCHQSTKMEGTNI